MRLPFLKFQQNAWVRSRTLAGLLKRHRQFCFGLQADLWLVALEMSPDEGPITGEFTDPNPAALIAAWVEWDGEPVDLLDALLRVHLVELRTDGFFVVGLPLYQAIFEERQRDRERKRQDAGRKRLERSGQTSDKSRKSNGLARTSDGIPPDRPPSGGRRKDSTGRPPDVRRNPTGRVGVVRGEPPAKASVRRMSGGIPPESQRQTQTQAFKASSSSKGQKDLSPPPPVRAKPRLVALRSSAVPEEEGGLEPDPQLLNRSPRPLTTDTSAASDLEPAEVPWSVEAFCARWLGYGDAVGRPRGLRATPAHLSALKALLRARLPSEIEPALDYFHSPPPEDRARWPDRGYPLGVFLEVAERHLGARAERRPVCRSCREPGELVASPNGGTVCYPCLRLELRASEST